MKNHFRGLLDQSMTTLVPLLFLTLSHYLDLECAGVLRLHGTEKMCGCSTVWLAGTHHQVDLRCEPPAERGGGRVRTKHLVCEQIVFALQSLER